MTNEILQLELIPDASNLPDDPSDHDFTWVVSDFTESNLEIKVTF